MKERVNELSILTQRLQNEVVGIYKNDMGKYIETVINEDEHSFTTLKVGTLLGVNTCFYMKSKENKFISFPENKTLAQMMDEPLELHKWFNKNVPNDYR